MSSNEYDELLSQHQKRMQEMAMEELRRASVQIDAFKEFSRTRGVLLTDSSFQYSPPLGVTAAAPRLLRALIDIKADGRDGLFAWADLARELQPSRWDAGYFLGTGFVAMADPCFRRQMHPGNNWAPRFIELFWALNVPGLEKSLALDEARVRIDVDGSRYAEADTWYGPPFNKEISQIASGNVKLRPPADLSNIRLQMFFSSAYCVDVKWSESAGIKTFQALELKTEDVQVSLNGGQYHPARYLHAEFDMQSRTFRHFDGAVQYLTEAEYQARRDSDFSMTFKATQHIKPKSKKVFKLNGSIGVDDWVELSSHFFAANPLMFEYFNGSYPEHILNILEKLRALPEERR
jgi:hypothetical protein